MDKKFKLPKEHFIDEQDVEGHRNIIRYNIPNPDDLDKSEEPGAPAVDDFSPLPSPPNLTGRRGHGGE